MSAAETLKHTLCLQRETVIDNQRQILDKDGFDLIPVPHNDIQ